MRKPERIVPMLLIIIFGVVFVTSAGWLAGGARWADLPSWIEAGSTAGALLAAALAVRSAASTFQIERTREAERQVAARQQQASMISAWPDRLQHYVLHNASNTPIYDLVATVHLSADTPQQVPFERFDVVPPTVGTPTKYRFSMPVLRKLDLMVDAWRGRNPARAKEHPGFRISLEFTDEAGQRWRRSHFGTLSHLGEAEDGSTLEGIWAHQT